MRCAAHILQLAICDSLKMDTVASLIIKIKIQTKGPSLTKLQGGVAHISWLKDF